MNSLAASAARSNEFEPTLRELLAAGHTARFCAAGDSMYPAVRGGDYLHVVPCRTADLRRGDIVLAATNRGLTAHRIVRIRNRDGSAVIVTRGDNALRADGPIEAAGILGRVAEIERSGIGRTSSPQSFPVVRLARALARRFRARFLP